MKLKTFRNKLSLALVVSLTWLRLSAQKVIEKEFILPTGAQVELVFPWVDHVSFQGVDDEIPLKIIYKAEGEYQNQIFLSHIKKIGLLHIEEKLFPLALKPNDKLSAHKNIVSNVTVYAPEAVKIFLKVKDAVVEILGSVSELDLQQQNGLCLWEASLQKGHIESFESNVKVHSKSIRVLASSQNGSVDILPIGEKLPQLIVQSINGDIMQR